MTEQIEMPTVGAYVKVRATGHIGRVTAWVGPIGNPVLCAVNLGDAVQMCTATEVERITPAFTETPKRGWYWTGQPNAGMWIGLLLLALGFLLGLGGGATIIADLGGLMMIAGLPIFAVGFVVAMIPRRRP